MTKGKQIKMQEKFDEFYKTRAPLKKLKPGIYFKKAVLDFLRPGTVLDLGAGDGRQAIFLAQKDFKVLALDFSSTAIDLLKTAAKNLGVSHNIKTRKSDIRSLPRQHFSNIISSYTLHFLSREEWKKTVTQMQRITQKGGVNLIEDFVHDPRGEGFVGHTFPAKRDLTDKYAGWEILAQKTFIVKTHIKEKDGTLRKAAAFFFLARKVS